MPLITVDEVEEEEFSISEYSSPASAVPSDIDLQQQQLGEEGEAMDPLPSPETTKSEPQVTPLL